MSNDPIIFSRNSEIGAIRVGKVEGQPAAGTGSAHLKKLLEGPDGLLIEITFEKGMVAPPHSHDHESYCYCVRGRIKSIVDGVEYVLEPGDAVFHPRGVVHSTEILEDSSWLEYKTPPEQTW